MSVIFHIVTTDNPVDVIPVDSLFGSWLAALSRACVVSDHVTEPEGHGGVTVVHCHHNDLLVRGALRQAGLVQDRLWRERQTHEDKVWSAFLMFLERLWSKQWGLRMQTALLPRLCCAHGSLCDNLRTLSCWLCFYFLSNWGFNQTI